MLSPQIHCQPETRGEYKTQKPRKLEIREFLKQIKQCDMGLADFNE